VGIQYLAAWLDGRGCVPIYNLMEDAATDEISRALVWQWLLNTGSRLAVGRSVTPALIQEMVPAVLQQIKGQVGTERFENGKYQEASKLFEEIITGKTFTEFLTLPAYEYLN
jgi:malate synthase